MLNKCTGAEAPEAMPAMAGWWVSMRPDTLRVDDQTKNSAEANGAMENHSNLAAKFPQGVGYFFPLSLKLRAM